MFIAFPGPLLSMANLLKLDLSNNQIQSLPADFGKYWGAYAPAQRVCPVPECS